MNHPINATSTLMLAMLLLITTHHACAGGPSGAPLWVDVSGTGVHKFSTAVIHSVVETEVGFIQRSTDIVELDGDLNGRILYHPESVFDFSIGTLVNTGDQVFSGTVLGLGPVMLHDDQYRFEVNLASGETIGQVFLDRRITGPNIRCQLDIVGAGVADENGDALFDYTGSCRLLPRQLNREISQKHKER